MDRKQIAVWAKVLGVHTWFRTNNQIRKACLRVLAKNKIPEFMSPEWWKFRRGFIENWNRQIDIDRAKVAMGESIYAE